MAIKRGYKPNHKIQGSKKEIEVICDICKKPIVGTIKVIIDDNDRSLGICNDCWEIHECSE